jgi:hypothetical protein
MDTIASPWRYDALASRALHLAKLRFATILRFRPKEDVFLVSQLGPYPWTAALLINPKIIYAIGRKPTAA